MPENKEITCPNCGDPNPADASRCVSCGTALIKKTCRKCGRPVSVDTELCSSCARTNAMGPPCRACGAANAVGEAVCRMCGAPLRPTLTSVVEATPLPEDILLGRKSEIKVLQEALEQCLAERAVVTVLITGASGIGKSHLLESFLGKLVGKVPPRRIFFVPCRDIERDLNAPFSVFLRQRLDVEAITDPVARRLAITGEVGKVLGVDSAATVTEVAHLLGHLAGVPFPGSPVLRLIEDHPDQLQVRNHSALTRFLKSDSKNGPAVLAMDDLHRLGPEPMFLLNRVMADLKDFPLLILASGKSSLVDALAELEPVVIQIEGLENDVMEDLFHRFLPGLHRPPEELVAAAIERASGNPASLRELSRLLVESGVVNAGHDPWTVDLDRLAASDLPVTLEDALKARRQRLEPREHRDLERAAVIGEIFWDEAVVALGHADEEVPVKLRSANIWPDDSEVLGVQSTLERLREKGFIVPVTEQDLPGLMQYAFTRAGLRDQICDEIEPERRSRYHRVAAEWLIHASSDKLDLFAEVIAEHWERGGERSRAGDCFARAARYARSRFLNQKAIRLFERALSCFGQEERSARIDVLHDLGSVYELTGGYDEALERITEMLYEAYVLVHRGKAGAAFNKIGRIYRAKSDFAAARAFLDRGLSLFKAAKDIRGVASSLDDLGDMARRQGNLDRAFRMVNESLELRRKIGDQRSIAVSLVNLGHIETSRASYREAARYYEEALKIRRKIDDRGGIAIALNALAIVYSYKGAAAKSIETWEEALQIIEEVGDRRMLAVVRNNLGETYMEQGALEQAATHLEACEELTLELDDRMLLAEVYRNMGTLARKKGEVGGAREFLQKSLGLAKELNIPDLLAQAYRQLAELEAATLFEEGAETKGDVDDLFKKAAEVFKKIGNTVELARTLKAYGTVLIERGKVPSGKKLLEKAEELFKQVEAREGQKIRETIDELESKGAVARTRDSIEDLTDDLETEGGE